MKYYLNKHWKINILIVFFQIWCASLSVSTNLAMIQITQKIIDLNMRGFLQWIAVDCAIWSGYFIVDGWRHWAIAKAKKSMNNHVRADIVATMLKQNYQEFHSLQSGEYLSWFTNDLSQISSLAWDPFFSIVELCAKVFFSVIALAQMHWSLLVVSMFVAAIILNFPKLFTKKIKKLSKECEQGQANATAKMKDLLAGFDVLKAFGQILRFIDGNREASEQLEQPKYMLTYVKGFIGEGIDLVNIVCQMGVNTLIGFLSINGVIIQSALMGGGNLCGTIYGGLASLSRQIISIQASKPYFEKVSVHAGGMPPQHQSSYSAIRDVITVDNLSFCYEDKQVLDNVSFRFVKGGKYALIGPSGCGKSTILKLLLGWLPDYQGRICFDGKDSRGFTQEQLLQQMSYIEQDVFLFNTTIRDNITLGSVFSDEMMEQAIKSSSLDGDLANMPLGMDTPVGEGGRNLSGGQKQRVAIARALIHNRCILLVDEGTSALDQKNADVVEQSLLNNPDLTLILVSHHLTDERKTQFTHIYELEPAIAVSSEVNR